jgi:hypothetical protein
LGRLDQEPTPRLEPGTPSSRAAVAPPHRLFLAAQRQRWRGCCYRSSSPDAGRAAGRQPNIAQSAPLVAHPRAHRLSADNSEIHQAGR